MWQSVIVTAPSTAPPPRSSAVVAATIAAGLIGAAAALVGAFYGAQQAERIQIRSDEATANATTRSARLAACAPVVSTYQYAYGFLSQGTLAVSAEGITHSGSVDAGKGTDVLPEAERALAGWRLVSTRPDWLAEQGAYLASTLNEWALLIDWSFPSTIPEGGVSLSAEESDVLESSRRAALEHQKQAQVAIQDLFELCQSESRG